MNFHQEVRMIPDPEVGLGFLWMKSYTQIHLALVEYINNIDSDGLGIAFPEYNHDEKSPRKSTLGHSLKISAKDTNALAKLDLATWLKRLEGYVTVSEIIRSDQLEKHITFTRYQPKNQARLRRMLRRRMDSLGENEEQAQSHISQLTAKKTTLPFIQLESLSNLQAFRLFIKKNEASEQKDGSFTTYGLSKDGATVPVF